MGYTKSIYEEPKNNSAKNGSTFLKTQYTKISGHSSEEVAFFYALSKQKQQPPLTKVRSVKKSQLFIKLLPSYKQLKTFIAQKIQFFSFKILILSATWPLLGLCCWELLHFSSHSSYVPRGEASLFRKSKRKWTIVLTQGSWQ